MGRAMSMKRSKEVRRGRESEGDGGFFSPKQPPKEWDWEKDVASQPDDAFTAYSPKSRFARAAYVSHVKFGKGIVIDVDPLRVEVLFSDGPRKLAHGLG